MSELIDGEAVTAELSAAIYARLRNGWLWLVRPRRLEGRLGGFIA